MTKKIDLIICVRNWIAQEKILEGQNLPLVAVNPLDLKCLFQYRLLFLLVILGVVRLFLNLNLILDLVVAVNLRLCGVLLAVAIVMVLSRFLLPLPLPLATAIVIVIVDAVIVVAVIAKMVQVQTQVVSETLLSRIPIVNLQSPVLAPGENSSSGSSLASVAHKSFALFSRLGTDS